MLGDVHSPGVHWHTVKAEPDPKEQHSAICITKTPPFGEVDLDVGTCCLALLECLCAVVAMLELDEKSFREMARNNQLSMAQLELVSDYPLDVPWVDWLLAVHRLGDGRCCIPLPQVGVNVPSGLDEAGSSSLDMAAEDVGVGGGGKSWRVSDRWRLACFSSCDACCCSPVHGGQSGGKGSNGRDLGKKRRGGR